MILSMLKGMKAELAIVIILLLQLLFLNIYIQNGTRLQQSIGTISKLLNNLEIEYQGYFVRTKNIDKQFSRLVDLKNQHNSKVSNKHIDELLLKHTISYQLKHLKPRQSVNSVGIKKDQPRWTTEILEIDLSIKHEIALLHLFSALQRRFWPYINMKKCKIRRVLATENQLIRISKLATYCTIKLYTLD